MTNVVESMQLVNLLPGPSLQPGKLTCALTCSCTGCADEMHSVQVILIGNLELGGGQSFNLRWSIFTD